MSKKKTPGKSRSETPSNATMARRLARQQAIMEAIDMPVHIIDSNLRLIHTNRAMTKWLTEVGVDCTSIIGKSMREVFPNLPARVEDDYNQVLETCKGVLVEAGKIPYADDIKTVRVQLVPLIDASRVTHVVTVLQDITEQVRAQEELRASEENYRALVENLPASIMVLDYSGTILFINSFAAGNWGNDPGAMIGKNVQDLLPPEYFERHMQNIRKVIDEKAIFTEETQSVIGGKHLWYSVTVQPYRDKDGQTVAALVIAFDITEKRNAASALRQSEDRFRLQFEHVPVSTYIWEYANDTFYLRAHNKAAVDFTNGAIAKFVGLDVDTVMDQRSDIIEDLYRCLREKKQFTREMPYTMKVSGKQVYLEAKYVYIHDNTILVHTIDITERKLNEKRLREARDNLEKRVEERTCELAEINEALQFDREALHQKNLTLRDVLEQIENGKQELTQQMAANIQKIIMPIIDSLESRVTPAGEHYMGLLRNSLADIASPLINKLEQHAGNLTPRELEICQMVRNGMTCKDIAKTLNSSTQTVLKQRSIIRRKLGISNTKQNLATFLKSFK